MSIQAAYKNFEEVITETKDWLSKELATLRTGRITPSIVESIAVEHYGTRNPLNSIASVANSDARTLVINPWDKSAMSAIAKAITDADIGVQPTMDSDVIRLVFPALTEETRQRTLKQVNQKAEEARVRLRQGRDEALRIIKEDKQNGDLTEDDFYDGRKHLDELIEKANTDLLEVIKKKEEEIKTV